METAMMAYFKWSVYIWQLFWNNGYYQYLLLAAAVYLLIFHRKKRSVRQALAVSAIVLAIFFFPLTAKVIVFCIGGSVYWRVFWLLPIIPVIALAATEFLRARRSKLTQTVLLLACCAAIAVSGKDMFTDGVYVRTANAQKVPDDVAQICDMIKAEAEKDGLESFRVMGDEYLSSYLRVYDPSVKQAYGRWGRNPVNNSCRHVYHLMKKEEPRKYRKIARLSRKGKCTFLVITVPDEKTKYIERYHYVEIGRVGEYRVYQLEETDQ